MKLDDIEVTPQFVKYASNDVWALKLIDEDNEPYGIITVNLEWPTSGSTCSFIDTNNCGEEIIEFLLKNNFGELTGNMGQSGFCIYPEFKFYPEVIERYKHAILNKSK